MKKGKIRILNKDIPRHMSLLPGTKVNVLLKNYTVLHGVIVQTDSRTLTLKDMHMNRHLLSYAHIEEIII